MTPTCIIRSLRAGATEFLCAPFDIESQTTVITRAAAARDRGQDHARARQGTGFRRRQGRHGQTTEMAKTRPAVIVSLDALNARLQTVTVCPLTSQLHPVWRARLQVRCGRQLAEIAVDQIRTISKSRLGAKIGALSDSEAAALRRLITEMYGE